MAKRMNFPPRREQRREDAEHRQQIKDGRTPAEHLKVLEQRGHHNCSEATAIREALRDGQVASA